jgi:hypothetical protein
MHIPEVSFLKGISSRENHRARRSLPIFEYETVGHRKELFEDSIGGGKSPGSNKSFLNF